MKVAALVSGGKDSTLALHKALEQGHEVECLVAMLPRREDSWMFHYLNVRLIDLFAEAIGMPLVKSETEAVKEEEVEDLRRLLARLNVEGVVHGAIASAYQKSRVDQICRELGLEPIAPLWRMDLIEVLNEILSLKMEVIIVGVYAYGFDERWLGRRLDELAVNDLLELHRKFYISIAGEGGEYETLVLDAPLFKRRINVIEAEKLWKGDCGILVVKKAELVDKR